MLVGRGGERKGERGEKGGEGRGERGRERGGGEESFPDDISFTCSSFRLVGSKGSLFGVR